MPNLGEQFNNTYFEGDDNTTPYEDDHQYGQVSRNTRSEHPQGLLFHPDTATQSRDDPMYSMDQRVRDIGEVTDDVSSNPNRIGNWGNIVLANAVASTNLSTPMLKNKPIKIEGMRSTVKAGYFSPGEQKLVVNRQDQYGNNVSAHDIASTFTHEWGHKEDQDNLTAQGARTQMYKGKLLGYREIENARSSTKGATVTSPVMEGVADGYKDRFGTIKEDNSGDEVTERYLNPVENADRHLDFTEQGSTAQGYGINFKGWRDKHEQALYAATRLHVSMHGRAGIESLPDMDALADKHLSSLKQEHLAKKTGKPAASNAKYANTARHLYLGQMMEDHPHVREGLKQLGLGDVGEYSRAVHAHYTAPLPPKEQSTLPGFEKLAPTAPPLPKSAKFTRTDPVAVRQQERKEQAKNSKPGIVRGKDGSLSIRLF